MDRNYLIDLALSIAQDAADEWHTKEALSGLETELDEVHEEMPDLAEEVKRDIEKTKEEYVDGAKLRRYKMDVLAAKSPNYDYHKRCTVKHRATSFVLASEAYLADPCEELYKALVWSEKRFWKALAELMGVEDIPNCGRCLSDALNKSDAEKWAKENNLEITFGKI